MGLANTEQELRNQLSYLIDRNILVVHQGIDGERLGLHVDTEEYIERLEEEIKTLRHAIKTINEVANGLSF